MLLLAQALLSGRYNISSKLQWTAANYYGINIHRVLCNTCKRVREQNLRWVLKTHVSDLYSFIYFYKYTCSLVQHKNNLREFHNRVMKIMTINCACAYKNCKQSKPMTDRLKKICTTQILRIVWSLIKVCKF